MIFRPLAHYQTGVIGERVTPPLAFALFPRGPALWDNGWRSIENLKGAADAPFTETCNASTPSQAD